MEFISDIARELAEIKSSGLWKSEEEILSAQSGRIDINGSKVINLCANNYLGLADRPELIEAAKQAMDSHGYGMASVRFICGTQDLHRQLEKELACYLGLEDAILFASCFDANGALFEPLLGAEDAVISDALNHASIIDGIRLSKARRYRYANADLNDLERQLTLARAGSARRILIATDGVFSMDGTFAPLEGIRALADQFDALLMVDDCHATGFIGQTGAGTPERSSVKADIVTGTFGKALGGAIGGYVCGPAPIVALLRQRARPYLFSNSLPPMVVAASLKALEITRRSNDLREYLSVLTMYWRSGLEKMGFDLIPGEHPIIPIMTHDANAAQDMAVELLSHDVYAKAFVYPVVPKNQARIRTQMSAALEIADLDEALAALEVAGRHAGVLA